jgi:hypothetical protein
VSYLDTDDGVTPNPYETSTVTADTPAPDTGGYRRFARRARCHECGRVFDLADTTDAEEWHYGHDCEAGGARADLLVFGAGALLVFLPVAVVAGFVAQVAALLAAYVG